MVSVLITYLALMNYYLTWIINCSIELHLMNICTNSLHLSILTVDTHSDHEDTNSSHIQIPAKWTELIHRMLYKDVLNVKFYAIFVSFICYLCCKAASCQLLINENSILFFFMLLLLLYLSFYVPISLGIPWNWCIAYHAFMLAVTDVLCLWLIDWLIN